MFYIGSSTIRTEKRGPDDGERGGDSAMSFDLLTDDANEVRFEDMFDLDDIQRLQDEFADATGVASLVTRPDGTPLTRPSNFTRLCSRIIRSTEKGCANCFRSDAALGRLCLEGPTIQPCLSGGLWDAGAGISVGGKHVANWLIGQVRDESQSEESIRAYAREIGADEEEAAAAFREVPSMSRDRFQKIARMLFTFATQLSELVYQNARQTLFIAEKNRAETVRKVQHELAEIMATAGSEIEVFNMVRRELSGLMETRNFLVVDYDESAKMFSTFPSLGSDEKELITRWPAEKSLTRLVIEHGKPMRFSKEEIRKLADEDVIRFIGKIRSESWVGVPLHNEKKVFGAMILQSYTDPYAYDDRCMEILQTVGNQLGVYLEKKRAEDALRESEELFRTFFEQNSVGFGIIKPGGAWVRFNEKMRELTGYSREELERLTWRDITAPEDIDRELRLLEALRGGEIAFYTLEKQYVRRGGSRTDVLVSTGLVRNADGSPKCYISLIQDISERKKGERELERHQEAIIGSMAILAEHRDHGTGEHIRRTKTYVRRLLERSGGERFFPPEHLPLLSQAAILHDIGKVGVPDSLLLKPGKLTPEEFEIVKRHTVIGGEVLGEAARILGEAPFIHYARQIIEFHHEKWDGTGSPHGLKGEEIPFIARIMAIADVYDALVSERPYKGAIPHEEAVAIIAEGAGTHFDPRLVEAFLACAEEFKAISGLEERPLFPE